MLHRFCQSVGISRLFPVLRILFFFSVEVDLVYNVLISAAQQIDCFIYIYIDTYTHIYILFIFFSIMVYHRPLNIAPCVTH